MILQTQQRHTRVLEKAGRITADSNRSPGDYAKLRL